MKTIQLKSKTKLLQLCLLSSGAPLQTRTSILCPGNKVGSKKLSCNSIAEPLDNWEHLIFFQSIKNVLELTRKNPAD